MSKQFVKDAFGWGFLLWLIGYALGIMFFTFMPLQLIGWVIAPLGTAITLWILFKKIKDNQFAYFVKLAVIWLALAVILDYFFLVKAFKVAGYYKPSVYLYYALTILLPLFVGWKKKKSL